MEGGIERARGWNGEEGGQGGGKRGVETDEQAAD